MSAKQEIEVKEFTRTTSGGRYTYALFRNKVARRACKRGRPHYELIPTVSVNEFDKVKMRKVNVTSQLARVLMGQE